MKQKPEEETKIIRLECTEQKSLVRLSEFNDEIIKCNSENENLSPIINLRQFEINKMVNEISSLFQKD